VRHEIVPSAASTHMAASTSVRSAYLWIVHPGVPDLLLQRIAACMAARGCGESFEEMVCLLAATSQGLASEVVLRGLAAAPSPTTAG